MGEPLYRLVGSSSARFQCRVVSILSALCLFLCSYYFCSCVFLRSTFLLFKVPGFRFCSKKLLELSLLSLIYVHIAFQMYPATGLPWR